MSVIRQEFVWHYTAQGDFPGEGGTKACVYMGDVCWFYWNPDTCTWHPINGWRRKIGYPKTYVTMWCEIPKPPVSGSDFF